MKEGQKRPHSKTPSPKRKRRSEDEHKFADACLRTKISPKVINSFFQHVFLLIFVVLLLNC